MSQTILIIEDDEASRMMYREILEMEGFSIAEAEDGKEALEYLEKNSNPKLILMDLTFPHMTPEQFVNQLKGNPKTAEVPFIFISGQSSIEDQASSMKALSFLKKPFDLDDFVQVVKSNI